MSRLPRPIICAVTSGQGDTTALGQHVAACARAGVDLWQLRERTMTARDLLALARSAVVTTQGTRTAVVINDRADVAMAARAAGVHLRGDSPAGSAVRAAGGAALLIGRSVHSVDEARQAERDGACDYLVFGTVFPSASKGFAHPVAGLDALRDVVRAVRLPVVAIGGVTLDRVPDIEATGAAGVAAIGLFSHADSLPAVVADLRRRFDTRS